MVQAQIFELEIRSEQQSVSVKSQHHSQHHVVACSGGHCLATHMHTCQAPLQGETGLGVTSCIPLPYRSNVSYQSSPQQTLLFPFKNINFSDTDLPDTCLPTTVMKNSSLERFKLINSVSFVPEVTLAVSHPPNITQDCYIPSPSAPSSLPSSPSFLLTAQGN